jgi:AcrR family transcriptional regulator
MSGIDENGKDTKNRIVRVALELFAKFGFEGVSTRLIAEKACCNIASLNYYFGTKKKLYQECLSERDPVNQSAFKDLLEAPIDREDFERKFLKFLEIFAVYVSENSSFVRLLINELNSDSDEDIHDSFLEPVRDQLEKFLDESKRRKIINTEIETVIFSRMVISVVVSQRLFKSFQPFDSITNEELARKLVKTATVNFYSTR